MGLRPILPFDRGVRAHFSGFCAVFVAGENAWGPATSKTGENAWGPGPIQKQEKRAGPANSEEGENAWGLAT